MGQHDALARGEVGGEQQVRAEGGLDLVLFREPVDAVRAGEDPKRALPALAGQRAGVLLAEEGLGAEPDALVRDQPGGRLVHQMAVLDALRAGGDRALDRRRRIGVHRDIGLAVGRASRPPRAVPAR